MIFLDLPGEDTLALSPHGLQRMQERGISQDRVRTEIRGARRKWEAARTLARRGDEVKVVFPALTLVLGLFGGEVCIITLWSTGEGSKGRSGR